jgi:hypothetical protein
VTVLLEANDHVAAHAAQADHSELHLTLLAAVGSRPAEPASADG